MKNKKELKKYIEENKIVFYYLQCPELEVFNEPVLTINSEEMDKRRNDMIWNELYNMCDFDCYYMGYSSKEELNTEKSIEFAEMVEDLVPHKGDMTVDKEYFKY